MTFGQLLVILADLAVNRNGGWLHQLSSLTDEVENMIWNQDEFRNVPVSVLELGPSHISWKGVFRLKEMIAGIGKNWIGRALLGRISHVICPWPLDSPVVANDETIESSRDKRGRPTSPPLILCIPSVLLYD